MRTALITGIRGQDGSYLAEILLNKNYRVIGFLRRTTDNNLTNLTHIVGMQNLLDGRFVIHYGDLLDQPSINAAFRLYQPDECYHLGAMSYVGDSWSQPQITFDTNATGTLRILEALRQFQPDCRFYFAGSSEQFGKVVETPQKETTPFYPRSPYGVSKVAGFYLTRNYRESYNLHASSGILFNHESARRGHRFVTRKITDYVARLHLGLTKEKLQLGNLDAQRDWGHSLDYMNAAWLMLQKNKPGEYVVASGETHSVLDFATAAFNYINREPLEYIRLDESLIRPAEVDLLLGDASKAKRELGWKPHVSFEGLVREMVENDIYILKK